MKFTFKDKALTNLIILFVVLNYCALIYVIALFIKLPKNYLIALTYIPSILFIFLLKYKTYSVIHWGFKSLSLAPTEAMHLSERYARYDPHISPYRIRLHVVESERYLAWYCVTSKALHLVFTSAMIRDFHEIDMDGVLAYLSVLRSESLLLSESMILLLATLAERAIITTPVAGAFMHLIRPAVPDYILDERALSKTRHAIGYKKMMDKLSRGKIDGKIVPASLSMNCIQNVESKIRLFGSWYRVHENLDRRVQALRDS